VLGVSDAMNVHDNDVATSTVVANPSVRVRARADAGVAQNHSSAKAGKGSSASVSLTLNATPMISAASTIQRSCLLLSASHEHQSAATLSAASTESIVSLRAVSTAIGRTAKINALSSAAAEPKGRRRTPNSRAVAATPPSASGRCRAMRPKPIACVLATCNHRSSGGLSIETRPLGSSAPKKKLCQE
jgi:hypothetical protein